MTHSQDRILPQRRENPCAFSSSPGLHLCWVCDCSGPKTCSGCQQAHLCSKEHQTLDWRSGHMQACRQIIWTIQFQTTTSFFQNLKSSQKQKMRLHLKFQRGKVKWRLQGAWMKHLRKNWIPRQNVNPGKIKIFQEFKAKIALEQEQILR